MCGERHEISEQLEYFVVFTCIVSVFISCPVFQVGMKNNYLFDTLVAVVSSALFTQKFNFNVALG